MKRILPLSLFSLVITGCALERPVLEPVATIEQPYYVEMSSAVISANQTLIDAEQIPQAWWTLFQSKAITQLVEQGLESSPTLEAAAEKLRALQVLYRAERDEQLLPSADLSLTANRAQASGAATGATGSGSLLSTHNASLRFSYQFDTVEGKANLLRQSRAAIAGARYQQQAAAMTLTANIVTTTIEIASLEAQAAAFEEIIADESAHLEVTEKQFQIGVIPKSDLLSQRASLAQTRTQLPAMRRTLAQARNRLALLTGTTAAEAKLPALKLEEMVLPQQLPVTLPAQLTRQRPDIRVSEALLEQAAAGVGVAHAARYPTLILSANLGTEANALNELIGSGGGIWGIGAGLTQPLIHADALQAREASAVHSYRQRAAEYRQQVLIAFQEVADALRALQLDSEQLKLTLEADRLASETLALVEAQHRQGAVSYLTLLNAQRQLQQARIQSIQSRAALYSDSAALMVALGGGWWNESEVE